VSLGLADIPINLNISKHTGETNHLQYFDNALKQWSPPCGPCCLYELFPNVCISLRIILTIPATVASAERFFALKTNEEESTPAIIQNHHGCVLTSNGLPANDFLYLRSEIVRNVIVTKFVCCADSDLLYISKLRPHITTWHRIPTSHNASRAVRNTALLHNCVVRLALIMS